MTNAPAARLAAAVHANIMMNEGTLLPEQKLASRALGAARRVRVWLPPGYATEPARARHPVLYLHDGQNVFSDAGEHCCFGWGNWALDTTAARLISAGRMRSVILVAVDNSRARYKEYRGHLHAAPKVAGRRAAPGAERDNTRFDAYAEFLIKELKPWVDREFRTLKTAANTGVMGSSLGGICSLSLAWEHPRTFGLAASLSGSFEIERSGFLNRVLKPFAGRRKALRLYLDSGVIDYTGDDDGRRDTDAVVAELRRIGWKDGKSLLHFTDLHPLNDAEMERAGLPRHKWDEARGSQHNEFYWRLRAWRALEFLFPPKRA